MVSEVISFTELKGDRVNETKYVKEAYYVNSPRVTISRDFKPSKQCSSVMNGAEIKLCSLRSIYSVGN